MNYIHSVYQNAGKISNEDLLYTLSLFALEPIRWIKLYEWRELIDLERAAIGTFWKGIGDEMGIDYSELRSAKDGWKDALHWLDDIYDWSQAYEERCMVPDINNKKTADETTKLLLFLVPYRFREAGTHCVSALMDDRLRVAMMFVSIAIRSRAVINCLQVRKATSELRHVCKRCSPPSQSISPTPCSSPFQELSTGLKRSGSSNWLLRL